MLNHSYSQFEKNGTDYEPDTLTSYHRSIARYLKENKYPFDMVTDKQFQTPRTVLMSKRKELKQKGKGSKPQASETITPSKEKLMDKKDALDSQVQNSYKIKCGYKIQCFSDFAEGLKIINLDGET